MHGNGQNNSAVKAIPGRIATESETKPREIWNRKGKENTIRRSMCVAYDGDVDGAYGAEDEHGQPSRKGRDGSQCQGWGEQNHAHVQEVEANVARRHRLP